MSAYLNFAMGLTLLHDFKGGRGIRGRRINSTGRLRKTTFEYFSRSTNRDMLKTLDVETYRLFCIFKMFLILGF